jgi:hypothetical protein
VSSTIFARIGNLVDYEHHASAFDDAIEVCHQVLAHLRAAAAAVENLQAFLDVL